MNDKPTIEQLEVIAASPLAADMELSGLTMADLAREAIEARRTRAEAQGKAKVLNRALQGCREMLADAVHCGRMLSDLFSAHMEITETELDPDDEAMRARAAQRLAMWSPATLENVAEDPLTDPTNLAYFVLSVALVLSRDYGADHVAVTLGNQRPYLAGVLITGAPESTAVLVAAREKIEAYQAGQNHPKRHHYRKPETTTQEAA